MTAVVESAEKMRNRPIQPGEDNEFLLSAAAGDTDRKRSSPP